MKITYIHHSAFLVETESAYLLFDYFQGKLPEFSEEKPLYVFASHRHPDHFSKVIFELEEKHPKIHYILAFDIWSKRVPESCKGKTEFLNPGQILDDGTLKVEGFKSTSMTSPSCRVRLKIRMRPDRKLLTMVCIPKPIPTERPPAMTARFSSPNPRAFRVKRAKSVHSP